MSRLTNIRAATFDVGGTLIEPWPSVGHVYAEVAARHGAGQLAIEILNQRFGAVWRATNNFTYTETAWAALVDATFAGLTAERPSQTFFPELYERFTQADAWKIFEDVPATLAELARRGLPLGVISNWDARLRPLLNTLGLAQFFQHMTISCDAGVTKPSPLIFAKAAAEFGLPPATILHVGDNALFDAQGAQAAGFQAVQIKRDTQSPVPGQIASLSDVLDLL